MSSEVTFGTGPLVGAGCKLYYSPDSGTIAIPAWVEVADVGDVSIADLSVNLAELKVRSSAYTKNVPGLFNSITVNANLIYGMDPLHYAEIQTDFFAKTAREWLILAGDDAIADSSQGLRCPMIVSAFPMGQSIEDIVGHDMQLSIAFMTQGAGTAEVIIDPEWWTSIT